MGYDIHVTRAENWANNEGHEIIAEEWLALIEADPELVPVPENGKYFVIWRGTTKYLQTWFDWFSGNIVTKYPDKATLRKMLEIAVRLSAHVQGDEGEVYDEATIEAFDDSILDSALTTSTTPIASPGKRPSIFRKLFRQS